MLALLRLNELLRKRTETDVAFTREYTWDIDSKETVKLRPNLELLNRTYQERKGTTDEGLTPDNLLFYLATS